MRVLITGATGLVGSELVPLLLKNGISVNYLTTSKNKIQKEQNYQGYFWNPEKGIIDEGCIDEVIAVIHLAGAPVSKRWTTSYKQEILESRVLSTNVLFSLIKNTANDIQHFISASATGIYPDSLTNVYSEEDEVVDNSFLGNVVKKWEEAVDQFQRLDMKVTKVRTGIVLSGSGGALAEMAKPVKMGLGAALGSGKQIQSWIHIRDLACIYYYILQHGLEGVYNGVAPYPVSNDKMMQQIAKILNRPYFMPNVPKFMLQLILGQMHEILLSSQNVSAKKIIGEGYQFKYLSLEKAIKHELL
ncbi:NAD-dependent epimerase [Flavobacterium suaedae]|uniref:NAD-dependent epimerase n=1 Tax=Flavobacterium suaedae TaxID=1767027 RepID=A0ABQ1JVC6_9FLAO|nr:TIGR01777 family oxidoreductase [Flavobacterium suaedae]GGB75493.1 NAD-dependent epimerase [Flavobacterium suaedae]